MRDSYDFKNGRRLYANRCPKCQGAFVPRLKNTLMRCMGCGFTVTSAQLEALANEPRLDSKPPPPEPPKPSADAEAAAGKVRSWLKKFGKPKHTT